jgi:hypothetical protein
VTDKIDVNTPPSREEVDQFINGLSDADKQKLKRQQLVNAAVNRKSEQQPNLGSMTDAELRDWTRRNYGY